METDLNFWLQLFTVAFCIGLGGRYGGVGLGAAGGLGVCILVLFFGLKPSSPPVSTILIIVAVIACTSILQGAGGLDWMVKIAERMLRRWQKWPLRPACVPSVRLRPRSSLRALPWWLRR